MNEFNGWTIEFFYERYYIIYINIKVIDYET